MLSWATLNDFNIKIEDTLVNWNTILGSDGAQDSLVEW